MTPALWLLLGLVAGTAGVGVAAHVVVRRRRARFAAEAEREELRHACGDPFRLAPRLAALLPEPGVADVRVLETLYEPDAGRPRGVALVEAERHPLSVGNRCRLLVRFDEHKARVDD